MKKFKKNKRKADKILNKKNYQTQKKINFKKISKNNKNQDMMTNLQILFHFITKFRILIILIMQNIKIMNKKQKKLIIII